MHSEDEGDRHRLAVLACRLHLGECCTRNIQADLLLAFIEPLQVGRKVGQRSVVLPDVWRRSNMEAAHGWQDTTLGERLSR